MDIKSFVAGFNAGTGQKGGNVSQAELEAAIKEVVPEWALEEEPPKDAVTSVNGQVGAVSLSIPSEAADVKADPVGTAESKTTALREEVNTQLVAYDKSTAVNNKISSHNTSTESHADLRLELQRLADRLNAALNSTDTSLDDLKEIVAYIKSNKTLIDGITSSKVNVTDIVNNLTTNTANVPLSAAQGVALKLLIDSLEEIVEGKVTAEQVAAQIATALSEYPTTADMSAAISEATKDLAPKSSIPTKVSQLSNDGGYLTHTTGDQRYPAKQATETALTEHGEKIAQLEEALANSMVEYAESVEWLEAYGDKDRTYYLPDGYEYTYRSKVVDVIYNANTADGDHGRLVDQFPGGSYGDGYPATKNGVLTSALIPIDPTQMSPDATKREDSLVTIAYESESGEEIKIYPLYNSSSIWTDYYKANGTRLMVNKGSTMAGIDTDGEITLPTDGLSYQLCNTAHFSNINWPDVAGVRISIGVNPNGKVTEEQLNKFKFLVDYGEKEVYGWYSTGKLHSDDPAVQENANNITNLQERMAAAEEELEQIASGVITEPLFAKLGLIGDSLTNQTTQGWQELAVSMLGNPEWHKNAVTGSSVADYGDDRSENPSFVPFVDRYLNTPSDCDCIVIMGGSNDATYQNNYELGTVGVLANNNYKGAYCTIIEGLLERNPATRIMLMTPPRLYTADRVLSTHIQKYVEATKEIAKYYGLPCLDLYDTLGWNDKTAAWCSANFAGDDPVHFSKAIGPRVGRMVANFIRQYY